MINNMIEHICSMTTFIFEMRHLSISQWDVEDIEFSPYSDDLRQQR